MKKKVLVTRPVEQAENLCNLIESSNGLPILFPTIEILPPDDIDNANRQLGEICNFEIGIFVSRNSAIRLVNHPGVDLSQLQNLQLFAIGSGTAQQLRQSGIENVSCPAGRSDSEALLEVDGLQSSRIANRNIMIFRGQGGREYLANKLKERGANVEYVNVYKRHCPEYNHSRIEEIWSDGGPDIIVVTSTEALKNLFHMLSSDQKEILIGKHLITIGGRIEKFARELGFTRPVLIAEQVNDDGLLKAMEPVKRK